MLTPCRAPRLLNTDHDSDDVHLACRGDLVVSVIGELDVDPDGKVRTPRRRVVNDGQRNRQRPTAVDMIAAAMLNDVSR
jgi:hypothetical protein